MPTAGKLVLVELNLTPEDITHVVFTHAHPDHIWGLLDDFDDPLFTEATYLMGREEWEVIGGTPKPSRRATRARPSPWSQTAPGGHRKRNHTL